MANVNKEIDEVFSEAGLHGKLRCWFNNHRKQIYLFCGALFLILLILTGYTIIRNNRIHAMQCAYLSLTTKDSRMDFIKKYKTGPLSGLVSLGLGTEAEASEGLKAALLYYALAVKAFDDPDMRARSQIAYAMCKLRTNDKNFFENSLDNILHDKKVSMHFRADALLKLANYFENVGDDAKIAELKHYADGLDLSDNWREKISTILK